MVWYLRAIHFKKELIESGEYTEFDIVLREKG